MTTVRRNSKKFNSILNGITTATVIGGSDPRMFTTAQDVVAACRETPWWTLRRVEGGYEISGTSATWMCY
jgi:hypothetical protein